MNNSYYSNDQIRTWFSKYLDKLDLADSYHFSALRTPPNVKPSKKALIGVPSHNRTLSSSGLKHRKAEHEYERALELLEELLEETPGLVTCLDRDVIFRGNAGNVWPSPEGVPRLINSRSQFTRRARPNSTY